MPELDDFVRTRGLAMFDAVSAGIVFTDRHRQILHANPAFCRLYGTSPEQVRGRSCREVLHPETEECDECWKRDCLHFRTNLDGERCDILLSSSKLSEDLLLQVIQDVTRMLRDLESLREEVRELRQLVEATVGRAGPLVVCCTCSRVRLEDGSWIPPADVEALELRTGLSHGFCPECSQRWVEDIKRQLP